jgi:hypothetical protein
MLNPETIAFIEGGQCIHIGTRNGQLESAGAMVVAVVVDPDRTHVTAFVPKAGAEQVMADLEANGQAALCFGRPIDDHACQVKGVFDESRAATRKERAVIERQWEQSLRQLEAIGVPRPLQAGYTLWPCLAVRVRVTAVFNQTPGPGAGAPLG